MKEENPMTATIYLLTVLYIAYVLPRLNSDVLEKLSNVFVFAVITSVILYISLNNHLLGAILAIAYILTLRRTYNLPKQVENDELNVPGAKELLGNDSLDNVSNSFEYVKNRNDQADKDDYKLKEKFPEPSLDKKQIQTFIEQYGPQGQDEVSGYDNTVTYSDF